MRVRHVAPMQIQFKERLHVVAKVDSEPSSIQTHLAVVGQATNLSIKMEINYHKKAHPKIVPRKFWLDALEIK